MSGDIPPDFEKPWDMADVVLHTEDGKKLHANKSALALFSPYYRALFFHDFKEKNDTVVAVKCGFETMKEILKHIHHVDFDYSSKGLKQYDAPMLVNLYQVADLYDFPTVRKLCSDQIFERPSVGMAKAAMDSDLHDLLMNILEKLSSSEIAEFVYLKNATNLFSKKDVQFFFNALSNGSSLWSSEEQSVSPYLRNHATELNCPQFDLTAPWAKSTVAIITKSSWPNPILYGNLEAIEMVSHNFSKKVKTFDENWGSERRNSVSGVQYVAEVDVEYTTMKEILSVIHHCNMDFDRVRTLHPLLLHDMFRAADVDNLDIPMIRKMSLDFLKSHSTVDAWEVMCDLSGVDLDSPVYKALSLDQRREWICRDKKHLFYYANSSAIAISPAQTDPLFTLPMVSAIISGFFK